VGAFEQSVKTHILMDNLGWGDVDRYGGGILRGIWVATVDGIPRSAAHDDARRGRAG